MNRTVKRLPVLMCVLTFSACMSESEPGSTAGEAGASGPQFSALCKNHFDALNGAAGTSPPLFTITQDQIPGSVLLANGGFEEGSSATEGSFRNTDPMYVYAGKRSAAITNGNFRASIGETAHYSSRDLKQLSLWVYSAHEEPVDFSVSTYGTMLDRIAGSDGQGYSGHSQIAELVTTVEPHTWVALSIDLQSPDRIECLEQVEVTAPSKSDAVFYVDEVELIAQMR